MSEYFGIPLQNLSPRELDLEELRDSGAILEIFLWDGTRRRGKIVFDSHFCYRNIDEGDAFGILSEIGTSGALGQLIYRVENSSFLRWFSEESQHIHDDRGLMHFCVCGTNRIVDILSLDEPKVEVL